MTSLRENAAALAGREATFEDITSAHLAVSAPIEDLPDLGIEDPPDEWPQIPVHLAWLKVRQRIKAIGKEDKFDGGGTKYNFRGIDRVLNAYGPATLLYGVNVVPEKVETSYRDTKSSRGNPMRECTATVTFRVTGPMGDSFIGQAAGESLDSGDKGSSKAQTTALRTFLLNGGLMPTTDPDPEMSNVERGEASVRTPSSYLAEILDETTSRNRLLQIHSELMNHRQAGALVMNEHGKEERIGEMVVRVGKERFAPAQQPAASATFCDRCEQSGHHPDACPSLNGGAS